MIPNRIDMHQRTMKCECIDIDSLTNLRLALLTARDTYNDLASRLMGMTKVYKPSPEIKNLQGQAIKFDDLIHELDNIPPCQ